MLTIIAGLAAWFGTRDSDLGRAVREQGDELERTGERVDLHERVIADQAVTIETNRQEIERHAVELEETREEIASLEQAGAAREHALEELRASARALEGRLSAAEGELARSRAVEEDLAFLREQLRILQEKSASDARRLNELNARLESLDRGRQDELDRLDRIERALGIDPEPQLP